VTAITLTASVATFLRNRRLKLGLAEPWSSEPIVRCHRCGKPISVGSRCERRGGFGGMGVPKYYHVKCFEELRI
jgi:hypothetical protein